MVPERSDDGRPMAVRGAASLLVNSVDRLVVHNAGNHRNIA